MKELSPEIKAAYLEDYDMTQGRLITGGVDLWLNNPLPPQEASGTSGMKACFNGVPNLSVLDGWWIEG
jgi:starch phosphorylase